MKTTQIRLNNYTQRSVLGTKLQIKLKNPICWLHINITNNYLIAILAKSKHNIKIVPYMRAYYIIVVFIFTVVSLIFINMSKQRLKISFSVFRVCSSIFRKKIQPGASMKTHQEMETKPYTMTSHRNQHVSLSFL